MKPKIQIEQRPMEFMTLCKNHNVANLYVFGSSFSDNFKEESSDIDMLIEIDTEDPIERGENLMSIWDKLESFFQRKVDLLTPSSIKNPVLLKSIEETKMLLYDGKRQKISF
jgi:uncharacterized protein